MLYWKLRSVPPQMITPSSQTSENSQCCTVSRSHWTLSPLAYCSKRQFWITMSEQLPPSLIPTKPALSPVLLTPG